MSGTGGPDDRDGDRSRERNPALPPEGYDFGYGGYTVIVGGDGPAGEPRAAPETLAGEAAAAREAEGEGNAPRESLLKHRMRARRAADRAARADPALSYGGRPVEQRPAAMPRRFSFEDEADDGDEERRDPAPPRFAERARRAEPLAPPRRDARRPPQDDGDDDSDQASPPPRETLRAVGPDPARAKPRAEDAGRASTPPRRPEPPAGDAGNRRAMRVGGTGSVVIEERLFEILDWSSGGIAIRSDGQYYRVGDARGLEVEIDLGDYAVNLDLDGEVVNRTSERTGWRFLNPSDTQRQVLRALVHAAQGQPFSAPRALPGRGDAGEPQRAIAVPSPRPRRRGRPLSALMSLPFNAAVIGLVALFGIAAVKRDASAPVPPRAATGGVVQAIRAAVAVERVPLKAPAPGRLLGWVKEPGEPVAPGEAVATISPAAGGSDPVLVTSPCDCILARVAIRDGAVKAGDELAALYPRAADGYVQALFLAAEAPAVGDTASVALAYTSERFEGTVVRVGRPPQSTRAIGLSDDQLNAAGTVFARLRTAPPVPAALAGDPAVVTIRPARRGGVEIVNPDDAPVAAMQRRSGPALPPLDAPATGAAAGSAGGAAAADPRAGSPAADDATNAAGGAAATAGGTAAQAFPAPAAAADAHGATTGDRAAGGTAATTPATAATADAGGVTTADHAAAGEAATTATPAPTAARGTTADPAAASEAVTTATPAAKADTNAPGRTIRVAPPT